MEARQADLHPGPRRRGGGGQEVLVRCREAAQLGNALCGAYMIIFVTILINNNWWQATGGKQLVVNQDRNIPKKKCMGSHWESNPRPPTLAVDTLTTELRLPCSNPAPSFSI